MELQLQHLCKQYGEKRAVNDVTAITEDGKSLLAALNFSCLRCFVFVL